MITTYAVPSVYATLNSAKAAIPLDLSGTGEHVIEAEKGTYPESLDFVGFINSTVAVDFVRLKAKAGDEHKNIRGSGVVISITGAQAVRLRSPDLIIQDIEANSNSSCFAESAPGDRAILKRCIGKSTDNNCFTTFGVDCKHINCIGTSTDSSQNRDAFQFAVGANNNAYNCIADNEGVPNKGFFETFGASNTGLFNCVSINMGAGANYSGTFAAASTNNHSEDASAPGLLPAINQVVVDMKFVSLSTDYHVLAGSTLLSAGTEQSAVFTTDGDGEIIDVLNWPVGVDFIVAVAAFTVSNFVRLATDKTPAIDLTPGVISPVAIGENLAVRVLSNSGARGHNGITLTAPSGSLVFEETNVKKLPLTKVIFDAALNEVAFIGVKSMPSIPMQTGVWILALEMSGKRDGVLTAIDGSNTIFQMSIGGSGHVVETYEITVT